MKIRGIGIVTSNSIISDDEVEIGNKGGSAFQDG